MVYNQNAHEAYLKKIKASVHTFFNGINKTPHNKLLKIKNEHSNSIFERYLKETFILHGKDML